MAVMIVQDLAKYWGIELLFQGVGFVLNEREKMALVGRNGAGKTTLLKILMNRMEYDRGSITMPTGTRVGYLSQDPEFTPGQTLLGEAQSVFAHLARWERDLRDLEARMGMADSDAELGVLMEHYSALTARYEAADAYSVPARIRSVLFGVGFREEDLTKPVEILSGGQKVRLGLAKLLLDEPDLLLLDEPTNHLDLEAVEWLEGYFKQIKSAAILVSHDRYFLDRVITRVLELEDGKADFCTGNYSYYLEEKERRLEQAVIAYERQQEEIAKLMAFYEKWRMTPSRKDMAMSRLKRAERIINGAEDPILGARSRSGLSLGPALEKPKEHHKSMGLGFQADHQSGNDVLKAENLGKAYTDRFLFAGVNLDLKRGWRIAFVGPNGVGKTTLLKMLHEVLEPTTGDFRWGVGIQRAYFSQDLDALDYGRTAFEEMLEIPGFTKFDAQTLLGRFLFSGNDAYKPIAQCSGGERNRLILAKLMVSGANVLLLDEPTNHLDLDSKDVLEESLQGYQGTVLFVSHDRFFIDQIATHVLEFTPEGRVTLYEGNYSVYREELEKRALLQAGAAGPQPKPEVVRQEKVKQEKRDERKLQRETQRLEEAIAKLEARKAALEEQLADPDVYRTETGWALAADYEQVKAELERSYAAWEELLKDVY